MAKKKLDGAGEKILVTSLEAHGIDEKYVFADSYDAATGTVTIVTNGGAKVRYREGDKVEPLDPIRITGINPVKRKPITGQAK